MKNLTEKVLVVALFCVSAVTAANAEISTDTEASAQGIHKEAIEAGRTYTGMTRNPEQKSKEGKGSEALEIGSAREEFSHSNIAIDNEVTPMKTQAELNALDINSENIKHLEKGKSTVEQTNIVTDAGDNSLAHPAGAAGAVEAVKHSVINQDIDVSWSNAHMAKSAAEKHGITTDGQNDIQDKKTDVNNKVTNKEDSRSNFNVKQVEEQSAEEGGVAVLTSGVDAMSVEGDAASLAQDASDPELILTNGTPSQDEASVENDANGLENAGTEAYNELS